MCEIDIHSLKNQQFGLKLQKTIQKRKVFNFIMQISLSNSDEKREKKENL
jgi:hypothetical protein